MGCTGTGYLKKEIKPVNRQEFEVILKKLARYPVDKP
jgi:hypothetical protein